MKRLTIFNTPIVIDILHWLAVVIIKLVGWRVDKKPDDVQKGILIGAPHTSNWDFPLMLLAVLVWRVDVYWVGKHTLFWGPFGPIMRWLGGIALDRRSKHHFTEEMTSYFNLHGNMFLVISPEGTRSPVERWKTGFYYMALQAGVPIVLTYVDYRDKTLGVGTIEWPTGNVKDDIQRYHAFYCTKHGKYPQNYSKTLTQD